MTRQGLWTAQEAAQATGGGTAGDWVATGVAIDSRTVEAGDLFIALEGPSFDGHDFIADAFAKGAVAAMTHRAEETPAGGALLRVDDTLAALAKLGAAARARTHAKVIGVTGSVGKTSTKEALARCLRAQAPTGASAASFNNHWGLPLSLARLPRDAAYGVFEVGMNHPGEIRALTRLLRPDVALITNVEAVHIGNFGSVERIADAKAEIFEGMTRDGVAVLNRDNAHFARLARAAKAAGVGRIVGFGRDPEADARLIDWGPHATDSEITAEVFGARLTYRVSLPGAHWVSNSLAILATAGAAGADLPAAAAELARLDPLKGRGERHEIVLDDGAFLLIDDAYNANPTSMRAAFEVVARTQPGAGGRRVAVLGDMLELGTQSAQMHRDLANPLESAGFDLVFTCGPAMKALQGALAPGLRGGHAADSRALAAIVVRSIRPGDVVMVKGSLGSRMAAVVDALKALGHGLPEAANGN